MLRPGSWAAGDRHYAAAVGPRSLRAMAARRAFLTGVASVLLASACQVDVTTTVTVAENGSGTVVVEVVLDREAFLRADDLSRQLRVDDLVEAGWEVTGPEPTPDRGRSVVAEKAFTEPAQAASILAEVTGPEGPLSGAGVARSKQFGRTEQSFEATLDLSGGIEAFSDPALSALLNDLPIGQDVATLEEELGAPLADLTSFAIVVDLPAGDVSSSGDPTIDESGERHVFRWEASLGDGPVDLRAQTGEINWAAIGLGVLALAAGLVLVVLLLHRLVARRRPMTAADPGP
jgi:hypothetical protein